MRAPAESTSQKIGTAWAQRVLGGPHDLLDRAGAPRARLDRRVVGDDAHRAAVDPADPGDHAVGGQVAGRGVGQQRVLDERVGVEQQRQPVAHEQLALGRQLVAVLRRGCRAGARSAAAPMSSTRRAVRYARRIARMATSSLSGVRAKSRAASISVLHSTSGLTPGSRRRCWATRSSPNICSPARASASPSV